MNDVGPIKTFTVLQRDGSARRGSYRTAHGAFDTPNFMPVGTRGSVKGVDCERLRELGAQITLVNTYHLWLRPGPSVVRALGDIHRFMNWSGPVLSDSGGFQVFSLEGMRTLSEKGVDFRSHIDGAKCFLSPEISIQIQEELGVDIAMVLDECPKAGQDEEAIRRSLEMTLRWAKRSLEARRHENTAIFGITQGGLFPHLREYAAQKLAELDFDGYAVGGLSVGEKKEDMFGVLAYHPAQLPDGKIRYLMGVGTPEDIVEAVYRGIDLFDCVMPTRAGRFGRAFVRGEEVQLNIKNAQFVTDPSPLDPTCRCVACRNYPRGYINHLFRVGEMLGPQLVSVHNLTHYLELMGAIREAIAAGTYAEFYRREKARWNTSPAEASSS